MKQILQKIINFIKYHNAFTICLAIVFVVGGAVFASETVRDAVIGEAEVERQGIDNTALLAVNFDEFDLAMTITGVSEDEKQYYIDYTYQIYGIVNNAWQTTTEAVVLEVPKDALAGQDLGLYVQEELSEVADAKMAYLREVQQLQQKQGQTFVVETTTYTGLIGLVLNPRTRELPGYEPVVEPSAMAEPFVGIEGVDEAGERAKAAESGNDQSIPPAGEQVPYGAGNDSVTNGQTGSEVPETILDTTPLVLTTSTDAVFVFHATVGDSTFQCQINNQGWYLCQSPQNFLNLTDGTYTFQVYAVDAAGHYDPTLTAYTWTIDMETVPEPGLAR